MAPYKQNRSWPGGHGIRRRVVARGHTAAELGFKFRPGGSKCTLLTPWPTPRKRSGLVRPRSNNSRSIPAPFCQFLIVTEKKGKSEREDRPMCLSGLSGPAPDPAFQGSSSPHEVAPPLTGAMECRHQKCPFSLGIGEVSHSLFTERSWAAREGLLDDGG